MTTTKKRPRVRLAMVGLVLLTGAIATLQACSAWPSERRTHQVPDEYLKDKRTVYVVELNGL